MIFATVIIPLFLLIGILLILIHVCVVGRAFREVLGDNTASERVSTGRPSMSMNDIEKLPCYDYVAKSKGNSPVNCAVCLDGLEVGDKCRLLPTCKHSFHVQCLDEWLLKSPICPICRSSADSRSAGLVIGEESSHFSDNRISIDTRGSQRTENSPFNDASLYFTEGQATINTFLMSAIGNVLSESQTIESNDIVIEVRQSQGERAQANNDANESTQDQMDLVGTHV